MEVVLLFALLTVSECGGSTVKVDGLTSQDATLSCKYNIKKHGALPVCWGRGNLPNRGCSNILVSTDGVTERTRASSRYQLLGPLGEGDVSLTILNLTEADAGRYGCRVEVAGPFNDEKHHFDLVIERAAQTTTSTTLSRETEATAASYTTGQMTSTHSLLTSSFSSIEAEDSGTVVLVCVLFGLVALVTAGGVFITAKKWRRLNKIPQQQQQVQFNPALPTLQLRSRGSAVENIYQIDEGGNGGEYEYCP